MMILVKTVYGFKYLRRVDNGLYMAVATGLVQELLSLTGKSSKDGIKKMDGGYGSLKNDAEVIQIIIFTNWL